jgi:hypothetical protein
MFEEYTVLKIKLKKTDLEISVENFKEQENGDA